MYGRRIIGAILVALLLIGLLAFGGYIGWTQGYAAGSLAASSLEDGATVVYAVPHYGKGFYPFFGFGWCFTLGFLLLAFFSLLTWPRGKLLILFL